MVNPVAVSTSSHLRAETVRALAGHGLAWTLVTRRRGDAGRLAAQAVAEGARVVVTLGGDGTAAEVAGALAGGPVAMAPLPGGNANVFARAIGWPNDPHRALAALTARARGRGGARGPARAPAGGRSRPGVRDQRRDGPRRRDGRVDRVAPGPQAAPAVAGLRPGGGRGHHGHAAARRGWRHGPTTDRRSMRWPPWWPAARPTPTRVPGPWISSPEPRSTEPWHGWGSRAPGRTSWRASRRSPPSAGRCRWDASRWWAGPCARTLAVRAESPAWVQADGEVLGRHELLEVGPGPVLRILDPRDEARRVP